MRPRRGSVSTSGIRNIGMVVAALVSAVIVSFLGVIGFVGLVCPHMVRRLIGDDQRFLIPGSCVMGILLLASDTVARVIVAPYVLGRRAHSVPRRTDIHIPALTGVPTMILDVDGVAFTYRSTPVIQGVTFDLRPKQILAILGPNGVGKTTLLKCMNAILRPKAGSIMVEDLDLLTADRMEIARRMGYVPQRSKRPDNRIRRVLLGRRPHIRWDVSDNDLRIVEAAIRMLRLEDSHSATSTRWRWRNQKVSIARALVRNRVSSSSMNRRAASISGTRPISSDREGCGDRPRRRCSDDDARPERGAPLRRPVHLLKGRHHMCCRRPES